MAESTTNKATGAAKSATAKTTRTAKATTAKATTTARKAQSGAKATTTKATASAKSTTAKVASTAKATTTKARATATKVADAAPTSAKDATMKAKDAAYTIVGLGVMGLHKAQTHTRDLLKNVRTDDLAEKVRAQAADARANATKTMAKADDQLETVIARLEETVEPFEARLPAQAQDVVRKARETRRDVHEQVRSRVLSA